MLLFPLFLWSQLTLDKVTSKFFLIQHAHIFGVSVELCLNKFFLLFCSTSANEKEVEVSFKQIFFSLIKKVFQNHFPTVPVCFFISCPTCVVFWLGHDKVQISSCMPALCHWEEKHMLQCNLVLSWNIWLHATFSPHLHIILIIGRISQIIFGI